MEIDVGELKEKLKLLKLKFENYKPENDDIMLDIDDLINFSGVYIFKDIAYLKFKDDTIRQSKVNRDWGFVKYLVINYILENKEKARVTGHITKQSLYFQWEYQLMKGESYKVPVLRIQLEGEFIFPEFEARNLTKKEK